MNKDQMPNADTCSPVLCDIETAKAVEEMENQLYVYSFYDKKAKRYDTPFFCRSDLFAKRHYQLVSEKQGTMMQRFSGDFELHRLASINQVTAEYTEMHENIIIGE